MSWPFLVSKRAQQSVFLDEGRDRQVQVQLAPFYFLKIIFYKNGQVRRTKVVIPVLIYFVTSVLCQFMCHIDHVAWFGKYNAIV